MKAQRMRRVLAGVIGLSLLVGVGLAPATQATDAGWVDAESIAPTTFTALKLLPPNVRTEDLTCANPLGTILGGTALTIRWTWPTTTNPDYPPASALKVTLSGTVDGAGGTTFTPATPNAGVYTTSIDKGLLDGLLGGLGFVLAGGQYVVYFRTSWTTPGGAVWLSPQQQKITVTYKSLLAGLGVTCVAEPV